MSDVASEQVRALPRHEHSCCTDEDNCWDEDCERCADCAVCFPGMEATS